MRSATLLLFAIVLAACSNKDSASNSKTVSQSGDPTPRVVNITAKEYAFTTGDTIQSGLTNFHLVNDGTMLHHAVIIRLDSGKTAADLRTAFSKTGLPPAWAVMMGGPNAPDPHSESNATLDLAAGNYAIVCMVDSAGIPHFTRGMLKPLTVIAATSPSAAAPVADDSVTLADYAFSLSKPLTAGHHTFRVVNSAKQMHEIELIKLASGKTAKELMAWMAKPNGPPPASAVGGAAPGAPGATQYFSADITPGTYLLICFVPDAKDGKPHVEHGMMLTQTVQ